MDKIIFHGLDPASHEAAVAQEHAGGKKWVWPGGGKWLRAFPERQQVIFSKKSFGLRRAAPEQSRSREALHFDVVNLSGGEASAALEFRQSRVVPLIDERLAVKANANGAIGRNVKHAGLVAICPYLAGPARDVRGR